MAPASGKYSSTVANRPIYNSIKPRLIFIFLIVMLKVNSVPCLLHTVETDDSLDPMIFNFTIPKNDPTNACLKFQATIGFSASYYVPSSNKTMVVNQTLETINDYTGDCFSEDSNMIEITFMDTWSLLLYFDRAGNFSLLDNVVLYYSLTGPLFPGSTHQGAQSEVFDQVLVNSTLRKSYTCMSGLQIDMGEVIILLKNVKFEPFFDKRPNLPFDAGTICAGDVEPDILLDTSVLVPIGVVAGFAVIVVIAFLVYGLVIRNRRKKKEQNSYANI